MLLRFVKKSYFFMFGFCSLFLLTACGGAVQPTPTATTVPATATAMPTFTPEPPTTPVPDPARGQLLYELGPEGVYEPFCSNCHTLTNIDHLGPGFEGIADRAATRVPELSAEEYIRQSIVDPEAYIVEGNWPEGEFMPTNYAEAYSEQNIIDLVAFLMTQ